MTVPPLRDRRRPRTRGIRSRPPSESRPDASRSRRAPDGPRRWSPASVEVPAVRPTVAKPWNQPASRSAADWTWSAGLPRSRQRADQLARVVRVAPADDHDRVDPVEQPLERALMLLGRQADRVDEPDLGVGIPRDDRRADPLDALARSSSSGRRSPAVGADRPSTSSADSITSRSVEVFDDPLDLDVSPPADHQDVIALAPGAPAPPDGPARPAGRSCR